VTESEPPTGEIPLPVTGAIPIYRDDSEFTPAPARQSWALWVGLVAAGSVLTAMTFPGQTAGLSPFTDPLIAALDIDRTAISVSYLIATLLGALAMPLLGRAMDRYGTKRAIIVIGSVLAGVLLGASFITEVLGLTASYVGLRMAGQGALSLAVTTLVARSITDRPGLALGIVGAVGSAGISLAPLFVESLVRATDISTAWRIEALLVALIVLPIALALPRDVPVTNTATGTLIVVEPEPGYTAPEALRTGMFWVLSGAIFVTGMFSTAFAFHLISILGAQGLSATEAAANFVPQTITAIAATLLLGALVDRIDPRWGVVVSMVAMAATMVFLPFVHPGFLGVVFGLLLGVGIGALRGVEAAAYLRYFGRGHLGTIRGIATSIGLTSTALGPVYFAVGLGVTGSYIGPSVWAALAPIAVVIAALVVKTPPAPATLTT
jgi:MFS family permease